MHDAMHTEIVSVFYRPEMTVARDPRGNYSKSPSKPGRFMVHARETPLAPHLRVEPAFAPLAPDDFLVAHERGYVEGFFAGEDPHATSNGLAWSPAFADTVRYTNGSLVAALEAALETPSCLALSPTSGFHHAQPDAGSGFCTFSGQVIAALRAWRARRVRGAWIDLDGHFGNSIEDTRDFAPDLDEAIPRGCNVNPSGSHRAYLRDLSRKLDALGARVLSGEIGYVCVAHGADSHEWDDLGGQCTTAEWLEASRRVYRAIRGWSARLARPVPVVLALFGGYRDDAPDSVLELHVADLAIAIEELAGARLRYEPRVERPRGRARAHE